MTKPQLLHALGSAGVLTFPQVWQWASACRLSGLCTLPLPGRVSSSSPPSYHHGILTPSCLPSALWMKDPLCHCAALKPSIVALTLKSKL